MFLGVSASVCLVNMDEVQRQRFAGLLMREQRTKYGDSKRAAYNAAGVNSATWDRLLNGLSVKPSTVAQVVGTLWPETSGDWTLLDLSVGGLTQDAGREFVRAPGAKADGGASDNEVLDAIREVQRELRGLSERLERLEGEGS